MNLNNLVNSEDIIVPDKEELSRYQDFSSLKEERKKSTNFNRFIQSQVFQTCEKCNDSTVHDIFSDLIICTLCNYGYKANYTED